MWTTAHSKQTEGHHIGELGGEGCRDAAQIYRGKMSQIWFNIIITMTITPTGKDGRQEKMEGKEKKEEMEGEKKRKKKVKVGR